MAGSSVHDVLWANNGWVMLTGLMLTMGCGGGTDDSDKGADTPGIDTGTSTEVHTDVLDVTDTSATDTGSPDTMVSVVDTGPEPLVVVDLVDILAGTFIMGSPLEEIGRYDDEVQHEVTLTHAFSISRYEVTAQDYELLMGSDPSVPGACPSCAVNNLGWDEAAAFTNALSADHRLDECYECKGSKSDLSCSSIGSIYACEGFRLPTEAEWEYAARGGGVWMDAFGRGVEMLYDYQARSCDESVELSDGGLVDDFSWFCVNSDLHPHPVGERTPSPMGVYDLGGNAEEWVHDYYAAYLGVPETDPVGPSTGIDKVLRGGSYDDRARYSRVAARMRAKADIPWIEAGMRVVRTTSP